MRPVKVIYVIFAAQNGVQPNTASSTSRHL